MLTVACVHWGTKFELDYVYNLKSAIERNTTVPHQFIVFSDKPVAKIPTITLKPGLEGWWNKLQLFDISRLPKTKRMVYFDLDTLITGNIDFLMNYSGKFMGIEDVGAVNPHQRHLQNVMQSGVMAWDYYQSGWIWQRFANSLEILSKFRGDGELLNAAVSPITRDLLQHHFPGKLKSYKYQVYPKKPDSKTSIVCFHGRPSIIEAQNEVVKTPMKIYEPVDWIKEYWR